MKTKPMTVRIPVDLYDRAQTYSVVAGVSIRDMVSAALESQLKQMESDGGHRFQSAVKSVGKYREWCDTRSEKTPTPEAPQ